MDTPVDLAALLRRLRLATVGRLVAEYEARAIREGWSHRDFLALLLAEEVANRTNTRVKKLARDGFYDGIVFHRVIEGFMAQSGDPTGTGRGGSKLGNVPAEFTRNRHEILGRRGSAQEAEGAAGVEFAVRHALRAGREVLGLRFKV